MTVTSLACDDQKSGPKLPASLEKVWLICEMFESLQHRPEQVNTFVTHALSLQFGHQMRVKASLGGDAPTGPVLLSK